MKVCSKAVLCYSKCFTYSYFEHAIPGWQPRYNNELLFLLYGLQSDYRDPQPIVNTCIYFFARPHNRSSMFIMMTSQKIYYVANTGIFRDTDKQLFSAYKHFVENTITDLGQDWRVESSLLSQQIKSSQPVQSRQESAEENMEQETHQDYNIFNQFMLPFLRDKIGRETEFAQLDETLIQDRFAEQLLLHFNHRKFVHSLIFSTLSLGFCITATDIWNSTFSKSLGDPFKNVNLTPIATVKCKKLSDDRVCMQTPNRATIIDKQVHNQPIALSQQQPIRPYIEHRLTSPLADLNFISSKKLRDVIHTLRKHWPTKEIHAQQLVYCISEFKIDGIVMRVIGLRCEFYRLAFVVWLIFNIKVFFTLSFQHYLVNFKALSSQWSESMVGPLRRFYQTMQRYWSLLLKDYSVALSDDTEVFDRLISNVQNSLTGTWIKQSSSFIQECGQLYTG